VSYQVDPGIETSVALVNAAPVSSDEVALINAEQPDKRLFRVKASARYVVHSELRVWLTRLREVK